MTEFSGLYLIYLVNSNYSILNQSPLKASQFTCWSSWQLFSMQVMGIKYNFSLLEWRKTKNLLRFVRRTFQSHISIKSDKNGIINFASKAQTNAKKQYFSGLPSSCTYQIRGYIYIYIYIDFASIKKAVGSFNFFFFFIQTAAVLAIATFHIHFSRCPSPRSIMPLV